MTTRGARLAKLEATIRGNAENAGQLCRNCDGSRGYRQNVEEARRRLAGANLPLPPEHCVNCGELTMTGAIVEVRRRLSLDVEPRPAA